MAQSGTRFSDIIFFKALRCVDCSLLGSGDPIGCAAATIVE